MSVHTQLDIIEFFHLLDNHKFCHLHETSSLTGDASKFVSICNELY